VATVPLSGTNIRLMTGVPFSNDYKNTRWFDTLSAQTNYFLNKPTTYTNSEHTFQRIEGRHFIAVNKSIDELWGTNYLMFQNTNYNSKWFYAFVTKLEYVQRNTTYVHFQIDVLQTWKFEMNFKPSFVVREHCKLWNDDGTPVINTIDEGLNYGTEYDTVSVTNYKPLDDLLFLVIVSKETLHFDPKAITPTFNGMPQPLSYYIHPFRLVGGQPILQIDGQERTISDITEALRGIMSLEPAVNNVISLYVTDYIGRYTDYQGGLLNLDGDGFQAVQIADNTNVIVNTIYVKNINQYDSITADLGDKYNGFDNSSDESKLLMYPYTVTIIDDLKGNRTEIKNEYINGKNLTLRVKGSMGTSHKVSYSVDNYLTHPTLPFDDMMKVTLEKALISNNPNDISIISDYLSAYIQGNRNQIDNQKSAIMWNGTVGTLTAGLVGTAQSMHFGKGASVYANPVGVASAGVEMVKSVGDAVIEMQGLQAKQRDIDNTPAQLVKMGGNSAFDFGNGYSGIYVIKKQVKPEYRKKLQDFFNMFGYKVNEVKIPNFHTRSNWNYVQTNNCNIIASINNEDLVELKNVFDRGITFWHTDDVGNYALINEVI
jgi:hypothetical protein